MPDNRTHREVKSPRITARFLADYMPASETAKRTIIRNCKYQPIAPVVQHKHAKVTVSHFFSSGGDLANVTARADQLRKMMADDDFSRLTLDSNADYLARFASVYPEIALPEAERLPPGKDVSIVLHDVKVNIELLFRLRRTTKTNETRIGAGMVRYAKNRLLNPEIGAWQASLLYGYLRLAGIDPGESPERKLCLTIDAFAGKSYAAPGDAVSRFKNMQAACASIAERWDNVKPPDGAIF
jgi:hypothetical protein